MSEIIRNRTIRPSSRLETSKSYKIDTKQVTSSDVLIVNIDHESKPFKKTFRFNGSGITHKNSISFRVYDFGTSIDISWSGAQPISILSDSLIKTTVPKQTVEKIKDNVTSSGKSNDFKKSFDPISNSETTVLILGSMPGDKSIELNEYYAHPRNRFWKIISTITKNELPLSYSDKKLLLFNTKIGVWDVAHKAIRKGSLDSAIESEEPNKLDEFISNHKNLRIIGFNGSKAEVLFDKYFIRKKEIRYISLPSTSPANTNIDFNGICKQWQQILKY